MKICGKKWFFKTNLNNFKTEIMNHKARFSFLFNSKTWCRKITTEGILALNINVTFPILTRFYSTFTQFYSLFALETIIYLLFYLLSQISWIQIYSLLLLTRFRPVSNLLILACLLTTSRIYLLSLFLQPATQIHFTFHFIPWHSSL